MDAPEPYTMNPPKSWPLLQVEVEVCEWVKSNETEANETDVKEGEESEKKEGELTSLHAALTLHPIPCTLHPTPPAPCTLHPAPHTPHPTTHTLQPARRRQTRRMSRRAMSLRRRRLNNALHWAICVPSLQIFRVCYRELTVLYVP